jgi:DNA-binding NarL/FixJ family response regulator
MSVRAEQRCDGEAGPVLLLVEEVCLYREGLAAVLRRHENVRRVFTAAGTGAALEILERERPDVVLIGLGLAEGRDLLRTVGAVVPAARTIVIGVTECDEEVVACAEAGASGFLLRSEPLARLVSLIGAVVAGETLCSPRVAAALMRRVATLAAEARPQSRVPALTPREHQVLGLLELGLSNQEIGDRLGIEVRTVKNHVHNILEKVGARRRGEAVAEIRRLRVGGFPGPHAAARPVA